LPGDTILTRDMKTTSRGRYQYMSQRLTLPSLLPAASQCVSLACLTLLSFTLSALFGAVISVPCSEPNESDFFDTCGGPISANAVAKQPTSCHLSTASSDIVLVEYTLILESQPAVANILPSERIWRLCCPECLVLTTLSGVVTTLSGCPDLAGVG